MNGLEDVKVGDKVVCLNTHGMPSYISGTYLVKKVTDTLVIVGHINMSDFSLRIRKKDGTSLEDGKYSPSLYYAETHPVIIMYRANQEEKKQFQELTDKINKIIKSSITKVELISNLKTLVADEEFQGKAS